MQSVAFVRPACAGASRKPTISMPVRGKGKVPAPHVEFRDMAQETDNNATNILAKEQNV
jgi:hypothetical protein